MHKAMSEFERSQQIARWTRVYAQNRSLGVAVNLTLFLGLSLAIFAASYFGGNAYRAGNLLLFWSCLGLVLFFCLLNLYLSVPTWGGKRLAAMSADLYSEGNATIGMPDLVRRRRLGITISIAFAICVLLSVALSVAGWIPEKSMQPVSAIYCVPFLVGLIVLQRPSVSYLMLIWPVLYALHAILIVAGAPIVFSGPLSVLNMMIPVGVYGLIASLICHFYNRFALSELQRLTREYTMPTTESFEG